jgi:hypothetical protein
MSKQDQVYWTLDQATAWVVYRDMSVVDKFSPPDPELLSRYFSLEKKPSHPPVIGKPKELYHALRMGRLVAVGRRGTAGVVMEDIPSIDWHDLIPDVDDLYRRLDTGAKDILWRRIRIKRADVERHWRRSSEIEGRSKYPKAWFQENYAKLSEAKPSFSKNECIAALEEMYQEQTKRNPPSRSTIQRYIKDR